MPERLIKINYSKFFLPLTALAGLIFLLVWQFNITAIVVSFVLLVVVLAKHLDFGWYAMLFLSPFALTTVAVFTVPFPLVVLVGLALFLAVILNRIGNKNYNINLPGIGYVVFISLSIYFLSYFLPGGTETISPVVFLPYQLLLYLAFVVLGTNVVNNKIIWVRSIFISSVVALVFLVVHLVTLEQSVVGSEKDVAWFIGVKIGLVGLLGLITAFKLLFRLVNKQYKKEDRIAFFVCTLFLVGLLVAHLAQKNVETGLLWVFVALAAAQRYNFRPIPKHRPFFFDFSVGGKKFDVRL